MTREGNRVNKFNLCFCLKISSWSTAGEASFTLNYLERLTTGRERRCWERPSPTFPGFMFQPCPAFTPGWRIERMMHFLLRQVGAENVIAPQRRTDYRKS
jgi:hypothetical protein